jgi:hypothetical protein
MSLPYRRFRFIQAFGVLDQVLGLQDIPCGRIGRNPLGESKNP